MQNNKKKFLTVVFCLLLYPGISEAVVIDLNDFFFSSGDPVAVTADGSSAMIGEDPSFTPIILTNDPFFGDPEVILADIGISLVFDFNFVEGAGAGENDQFGAFIIDPLLGGSLGSGLEFFTTDTSSGKIAFDLTSLVGTTGLGLEFQLFSLPGDTAFDSVVTISNIRLEQNVGVIPLPGSFYLFASGLIGLWRIKASKHI